MSLHNIVTLYVAVLATLLAVPDLNCASFFNWN